MRKSVGEIADEITNNNDESDDNSDEEDEDDKKSTTSKFSYFSINSSKSSAARKKNNKFANYVTCVQTSLKWKAALLRGRARRAQPSLTDEDVSFLTSNTFFSETDIREWWREFMMDCPDGMLTKDKVLSMLTFILPRDNGKIVADLIFTAFDKDRNGWIDFNEFIIATHCSATSSPSDKLHWVFQMYDKDQSGTIELGEMVELFGTLYLNEGLEMEAAVERAMAIFSTLDINNDGDVTEDEFVRGCLEDEELVKALSDKSSEPPLVVNISNETTPRGMTSIGMAMTQDIRTYSNHVVREGSKMSTNSLKSILKF